MVSLDMMLTLAYSMFENLYYDSGLTSPRRAGVNAAKESHFVYVH